MYLLVMYIVVNNKELPIYITDIQEITIRTDNDLYLCPKDNKFYIRL